MIKATKDFICMTIIITLIKCLSVEFRNMIISEISKKVK